MKKAKKMKLKIEVELDDIWFDDESSVGDAVEARIKNEIVNQVWKKIESKVDDQVGRDVKKEIDNQLMKKIQLQIKKILSTGVLPGRYASDKKLTIDEWIEEQFMKGQGYNNPQDIVKSQSEKLVKELRDRYDMMFASQIVSKLNEQGMLKDDVAKMLLYKKEN